MIKQKELVNSVNFVLCNEKDKIKLSEEEKQNYYKCFFAYCKDNYNEDFDSSDIPITQTIIKTMTNK